MQRMCFKSCSINIEIHLFVEDNSNWSISVLPVNYIVKTKEHSI